MEQAIPARWLRQCARAGAITVQAKTSGRSLLADPLRVDRGRSALAPRKDITRERDWTAPEPCLSSISLINPVSTGGAVAPRWSNGQRCGYEASVAATNRFGSFRPRCRRSECFHQRLQSAVRSVSAKWQSRCRQQIVHCQDRQREKRTPEDGLKKSDHAPASDRQPSPLTIKENSG